ncbi:MAG: hypothetical protein LJE70_17230 [Chromatiaceae bacterium]|nr:hypothetical protein [Chromatiaceae bacterium]
MRSNRGRQPLRIRPRFSRLLTVFLSAIHGAALILVFAIPLDWYWQAGIATLVISGFVYAMGDQVLFMVPWAVREATWRSDGTWTLTLVSGEQIEARLLASTFVSLRLLVLNFRCGLWYSRTVVLAPDALDAQLLRRLRVQLKLRGIANNSGSDALS